MNRNRAGSYPPPAAGHVLSKKGACAPFFILVPLINFAQKAKVEASGNVLELIAVITSNAKGIVIFSVRHPFQGTCLCFKDYGRLDNGFQLC
jgi:hypothetical protein